MQTSITLAKYGEIWCCSDQFNVRISLMIRTVQSASHSSAVGYGDTFIQLVYVYLLQRAHNKFQL